MAVTRIADAADGSLDGTTSTSSIFLGTGNATTPGRMILLLFRVWDPELFLPTVTSVDVAGTAATLLVDMVLGAGNFMRAYYLLPSGSITGLKTCTLTMSANCAGIFCGITVGGVDLDNPTATATGTASSTDTATTISNVSRQDLIVDFCGITQAAAVQPRTKDLVSTTVRQDIDVAFDAANNYSGTMSTTVDGDSVSPGYTIALARTWHEIVVRCKHKQYGEVMVGKS